MFSGLTKELGRIPKKNKPVSKDEGIEKSSETKTHESQKDKESKHKGSKHRHDKDHGKTKKSEHHKEKEKSKRMSDDSESVIASERDNDMEMFDAVGSGFGIQEMVKDALSGREQINTKSSLEKLVHPILNDEKDVLIPGFGDLDELNLFQSRSKAEVKRIKRSVRVTDSDLKISLPADMERKGKTAEKLDLQTLVNLALFGDEVGNLMTAACLHLHECVLTLNNFTPSSWIKSVNKEMVDSKNKLMYTVKLFNPEHVQSIGKTTYTEKVREEESECGKTNNSRFDDVTKTLMSIVQKEDSRDWKFPKKENCSGKPSADKVLVIPAPTITSMSLDDDYDDDDDEDDGLSRLNRGFNDLDRRIVISGKVDNIDKFDKELNAAKEVKTSEDVTGIVEEARSEVDIDKNEAGSMAAPTSRPNTPSINQTRKKRSSSIEKESSRISKKSESQDRKRSRSKERSSRENSKDRRRSRSRHRSSRSHSRDRSGRSKSRERRDCRTETSTDKNKDDIKKRLAKIASSAVSSDPDKMTSRTEKRRERQFHPYKKDSRPSKRHIPHWSFDLAYSDMNELLQNLTENSFKKANCKPANVGSFNRVGRRR